MILKLEANKNRTTPIYFVEGVKGFHFELKIEKLDREFAGKQGIKFNENDYLATIRPIAMNKNREAAKDFTFDYIKEKASKADSIFNIKHNELKKMYAKLIKKTVKSNTVGALTYYYTYFLKLSTELNMLKANIEASNQKVSDGYFNAFYVKAENLEGFLMVVDNWSEKQKVKEQSSFNNKVLTKLKDQTKIENEQEVKQQKVDEELFP